jgi:hypothetical protein
MPLASLVSRSDGSGGTTRCVDGFQFGTEGSLNNTANLLASRSGTCFLKGFTFQKTTKSTTL